MDKYKLKWTRLQNEIFRLLCIKAGKSFTQRNISLFLDVSPTAVSKSLKSLVKDDFVIVEKYQNKNNIFSIELNRNSELTIYFKRCENLKMIYEIGLIDYLEDIFPGSTIVLFGSYSNGYDTFDSDIDIAVIGVKEKNVHLKKFEKFLERDVIINFYDSFKSIHKNLRDNILNGILLSGSIEL